MSKLTEPRSPKKISIVVCGTVRSSIDKFISGYYTDWAIVSADPTERLGEVEREIDGKPCLVSMVNLGDHWTERPVLAKQVDKIFETCDAVIYVYSATDEQSFKRLKIIVDRVVRNLNGRHIPSLVVVSESEGKPYQLGTGSVDAVVEKDRNIRQGWSSQDVNAREAVNELLARMIT